MHVRKDGTTLNVDSKAVRFEYRGTPHILCIFRDMASLTGDLVAVRIELEADQRKAVMRFGVVAAFAGGDGLATYRA